MRSAATAVRAFRTYGQNKGTREKILGDLVDIVKKDRPGVRYRWKGGDPGRGGPEPGPHPLGRYGELGGAMTETLNKMTEQHVASPEDWFDLRDKYKNELSALFVKK